VANLEPTGYDDEKSLCCGGSLGNIMLNRADRRKIASDVTKVLTKSHPDYLATACPLCKKTLAPVTDTRVADIAEIVAGAIVRPQLKKNHFRESSKMKESAGVA
jgi:Fe-S oxidoreductase